MDKKNLATCTPIEFLKQTSRIKKAVEKWLTVNEITEIRKRMPDFNGADTKEQKAELIKKKAFENMSLILDNCLEKHPEETLEVLALACFVEPQNVNDYPMSFYLGQVAELMSDEGVLSFFISLSRLGQMNTLSALKASGQIS